MTERPCVPAMGGTAAPSGMSSDVPTAYREIVAVLEEAGASFAFLHGSRARGSARDDSDIDVGAWWERAAPAAFDLALPPEVDLLVLNTAPLELAGRVAVEGVLILDRDVEARVHWVATTRKIYFDELPRLQRAHREFAEALTRG